ncbi:hypothetical protein LTR84_011428 [Exophiala bonariae]|uniref:chitinase n=1 Tax=Exophiala bonariae TaxID=1690606 RepID=A0AAV9MS51_9EURO|nr:hypothetical protein LTR84_011428 [Exophiala bonariae]
MLFKYVHFLALLIVLTATAVLSKGSAIECGPAVGGARCGLNTCCSVAGFCGTTSAHCGTGCQPGYGSCVVPTAPSCDASKKSATNGRRVGYWQVQQVHDDACDVVLPADIDRAGMTHLLLAFAHFDLKTFDVIPANATDERYYAEFTALKSDSLQTWIAVGGGAFGGAKWSAMARNATSRTAFVSSLKDFMDKYSFQGVDLDWEFPDRSGSDAQNFVALAKEIKDTIRCGISTAVPSDWGSVKGFDIDGLSNYLDFFNFMGYDIHGWGIDEGSDRTKVTYGADIRDIAVELLPLWANATQAGQVNLGVPYYGRGYTLSNYSCTIKGCKASGPSKSGKCTPDPSGVMTLGDLATVIKE